MKTRNQMRHILLTSQDCHMHDFYQLLDYYFYYVNSAEQFSVSELFG